MKQYIFFTVFLLLLNFIKAQNDEAIRLMPKDSVLLTEKIDMLISLNSDTTFDATNKALIKLGDYLIKCDSFIYLQTKILNYFIDKYPYHRGNSSRADGRYIFFNRKAFTPEIKQKLLKLLEGKFSKELVSVHKEEELSYTVKSDMNMHKKYYMEKTGFTEKEVEDSLKNAISERKRFKNFPTEITRYYDMVIYLVGWLEMKEAVPLLKNILKDDKNNKFYNTDEITKLALARLGEKEFIDEFREYVKEYINSKDYYRGIDDRIFYPAFYVCDTTAIRDITKLVGSKSKYYFTSNDGETLLIGHKIIFFIENAVENFPYEFYGISFPIGPSFVKPDAIPKTVEWLKKNELIINRDFYSFIWGG